MLVKTVTESRHPRKLDAEATRVPHAAHRLKKRMHMHLKRTASVEPGAIVKCT